MMSCLFLQHISILIVIIVMKIKKPTILFDGICNLCNSSVSFIQKRDKNNRFEFVALQSAKGKELMNIFRIPKGTDSLILIQQKSVFMETNAVIEITKQLPIPWKWFSIFRVIPENWRNRIYRWVAKNRYRWFGKNNVCSFQQ